MTARIIAVIDRYLVEQRLSRAQLAVRSGVSESLLNKLLSGQEAASTRTLMKISAKTGLVFETPNQHNFNFGLHSYQRADVAHLEGCYQTLRPSWRCKAAIQCFETIFAWDEMANCLGFAEVDNDLAPGNHGYVSVPLYQRILYLLGAQKGNFRLAMLSDADEPGIFYGSQMIVASKSMAAKAPAVALFVLHKTDKAEDIVRGVITADHPHFAAFDKLLCFGRDEGFCEFFGW